MISHQANIHYVTTANQYCLCCMAALIVPVTHLIAHCEKSVKQLEEACNSQRLLTPMLQEDALPPEHVIPESLQG